MVKKQKKEVENLLDKLITSQTILDECEKKIEDLTSCRNVSKRNR